MANTLNLNSLPEYIEAHKDELFVKSVAGAKSLDFIDAMLGVKHKDAINTLDSEVVLAEATCEWNPAGSDTFGQRYIEVHPVSVQKEFCFLDFQNYYMNYQLNFQAGREKLPFEEKIAQSNINAIQEAVEAMVWQGNSGASVTGLLADLADASATTIEFATGDTAVAKIDAMVAGLTAGMLKQGVNLYVSMTDFRNYVLESNGTCCANRPVLDAAAESITYAGDSRVKIVPVLGLEGTGKMVAATPRALVYGTDIEGSESVYRWFYDDKNRKFCFDVLFNFGTAVRRPDEAIIGE